MPLDPPVPGSNLSPGPHHRVVGGAAYCSVNTVQINYKTRPRLAVSKKKICRPVVLQHKLKWKLQFDLKWWQFLLHILAWFRSLVASTALKFTVHVKLLNRISEWGGWVTIWQKRGREETNQVKKGKLMKILGKKIQHEWFQVQSSVYHRCGHLYTHSTVHMVGNTVQYTKNEVSSESKAASPRTLLLYTVSYCR